MKIFFKNIFALIVLCITSNCESKSNQIVISTVSFDGKDIKTASTQSLNEGVSKIYKLKTLTIRMSASYYSNNLYEYDPVIIQPQDSLSIKSMKEENIPIVISENKNLIDLDYYRVYNVFFDTINQIPLKIMEPRIPYTNKYICFIARLPHTFKKGIGYQSLTIEASNVKSTSDIEIFEKFVKSIAVN